MAKNRKALNDPTEMERRLDQVLQLMNQDLWVNGRSHRMMMQEWGVSLTVVKTVAAEAGRIFRGFWRQKQEELAAEFESRLRNLELRARRVVRKRQRKIVRRENGRRFVDYEDVEDLEENFAAQISAIELAARLRGMLVQKVEVKAPEDEFSGWTDAELEHFANTGERPKRDKTDGSEPERVH